MCIYNKFILLLICAIQISKSYGIFNTTETKIDKTTFQRVAEYEDYIRFTDNIRVVRKFIAEYKDYPQFTDNTRFVRNLENMFEIVLSNNSICLSVNKTKLSANTDETGIDINRCTFGTVGCSDCSYACAYHFGFHNYCCAGNFCCCHATQAPCDTPHKCPRK